jgi:G protein-coupled receptor Mth (Methuselah protein)
MKMQLLQCIKMNATVYLIFVTIFLNISHAARPAAVTINKCCRIGEHMDKTKQCVPGASDKWVPKVYLLARKTYYAKVGEAPQHMKVMEESLPQTCGNPQYFSGTNNLAIISNGSLYLQDKDIMSPPEDYCVDKDAALVCYHKHMDALTLPQILSSTRKCCGPNSAYSYQNATCVNLDQDHQLFHTKVVKSPQVEVLFGFPECELHDFAIAGQFSDQEFNDNTGTLIMSTGKVFQANQFCLEHVVEGNMSAIKVFACSEHFPQAEIPVHQNDVRFSLYSIGLLISVFFLAATLAAGFLMPSNHHILHWRCQTNYIMCLLVGDLLLALTQMAENGIMDPYCTLIGEFCTHFF